MFVYNMTNTYSIYVSMSAYIYICVCVSVYTCIVLLTYLLTYSLTHSLTYLLTYLFTYLFILCKYICFLWGYVCITSMVGSFIFEQKNVFIFERMSVLPVSSPPFLHSPLDFKAGTGGDAIKLFWTSPTTLRTNKLGCPCRTRLYSLV
jgi:hypothetical protein